MSYEKRKRMYITGGAIMVSVIVCIIFAIAFTSCSGSSKYEDYYDAAESAFLDGSYEEALKKLEKAMDIEHTEECYLLMAETYYAMGDTDMAIQVLYLGYTRVGSDAISQRLEELKAIKNGSAHPNSGSTVSIGGTEYSTGVTSLVLSDMGLTDSDIVCIAELDNLESLSLSGNNISDLSPLSGLTELTFLQISDCRVSDLSPLQGLARLKTLYIDGNPVSDLSPLYSLSALKTLSMKNVDISGTALTELKEALPACSIYHDDSIVEAEEITLGGKTFASDVTELDLGGLDIEDISQLSKCKNLVKLDLRDNSISDISPLVDLQQLEWLCLWNNEIEDLRPIMSLEKLKYLDIDGNKATDISPLGYLELMEELWISGNSPESFQPLSRLENLRRLGVKNTGITDDDLDVLAGIETLEEIALEDNEGLTANKVDELKAALPGCEISHSQLLYLVKLGSMEFKSDAVSVSAPSCGVNDITGLDKFTMLENLNLTGNSVSDLSPLAGLTTLKTLNLYGNRISDVSALASLSGLTELDLTSNNLTSISALAGLSGLTKLSLSFNSVYDLSPLAGLSSLTELQLDANMLDDLSGLEGLTSLKTLWLENNRISDFSALYGLENLETLYIRGNSAGIAQIMALREALPNCTIYSDYGFLDFFG